ncbi:MarR family winged helix-turn-helix transcriptional regulator [Agromyces sp. SYSU T0242]|uniref:MarR family winged helix-turn-helix transcriptional regulator n=1 Tax=Agromyces litoreus TaxID=3158561 RepID=UPI003390E2E7
MADRTTAVAAWEALFRAQVSIMRGLAAEFPTGIMSLNEYDVLFNITRVPGRRLRLKDLNRHVLISQPSVSRLVDRLAARGWVEKVDDPLDGRGTIVQLTADGYEAFRRAAVHHVEAITDRVGGALDEAELNELIDLCDRLRQAQAPVTARRRAGAVPSDADAADAGA